VADVANHELDEHVKVTENVLKELGAGDKPRILVLNKADTLDSDAREALSFRYSDSLPVSAHSGEGIDILMERLGKHLDASRPLVTLRLPTDRWDIRARLHKESSVLNESYDDGGLTLTVRLSSEEKGRLSEFVIRTVKTGM